jgi:hypothetical protein
MKIIYRLAIYFIYNLIIQFYNINVDAQTDALGVPAYSIREA